MMCSDTIKLNAAVRAYLVSQGYKLTALTLSEEGGNSIPAALPPDSANLINLFQGNAQKVAAAEARQVDIQCGRCCCPAHGMFSSPNMQLVQ